MEPSAGVFVRRLVVGAETSGHSKPSVDHQHYQPLRRDFLLRRPRRHFRDNSKQLHRLRHSLFEGKEEGKMTDLFKEVICKCILSVDFYNFYMIGVAVVFSPFTLPFFFLPLFFVSFL